MLRWIQSLDNLLRGETTRLSALRTGRLELPLRGLTALIVLMGVTYGLCMGVFALLRETGPEWRQLIAASVKVPALFLLTLAITFPSLYVFNALVGSRLRFLDVLRLLIAGISVTLAVLASFGPIVAFFAVSTTSYPFMVLLNVLMFAVAGLLGLSFLLQTLHRLSIIHTRTPEVVPDDHFEPVEEAAPTPSHESSDPPSPLDMPMGHLLAGHVKSVFRCWIVVFGLVGAQMSWVLRPFIGNPDQPFTWFRPRDSNFFEAVWHSLLNLFQ
ncbi:MAG TPA: hypothetical protein VM165_20845 [Planctomycetaceae bacterium]|nr:hypothetical protein [Planctomycetaceae bacterium]